MAGNAIWALKHATETTAAVFYRGLSNGVLTLVCNGQTFTGDTISTAVGDGTGLVTATGLSAGTSYPFTMYLAGVSVATGTLRTAPAAGSTFTIGFGFCWKYYRPSIATMALQEKFGDQLAGFVFCGDFPYLDDTLTTNYTRNGETIRDVGYEMIADPTAEAVARASIYAHHRFYWQIQGVPDLMHAVPSYICPSDHDVGPGDNWDYTIAKANAYHTWATTQGQVDNMGLWCQQAMRQAYYKGNPSNSDAHNDASWSANEQTYFAFDWGDATIIVLDGATDCNWINAIWGTEQTAWLKATLLASTKTFKIVISPEMMTEFSSNLHTINPEIESVFDYVVAQGITGVVFGTGDIHIPAIFSYQNISVVRAGPAGQTPHLDCPSGYVSSCRYKWQGYNSNPSTVPDIMHGAGYVTVHGADYLEIGMITDTGCDLLRPIKIYAGTNTPETATTPQ